MSISFNDYVILITYVTPSYPNRPLSITYHSMNDSIAGVRMYHFHKYAVFHGSVAERDAAYHAARRSGEDFKQDTPVIDMVTITPTELMDIADKYFDMRNPIHTAYRIYIIVHEEKFKHMISYYGNDLPRPADQTPTGFVQSPISQLALQDCPHEYL